MTFKQPSALGPFKPTLILHGGAGSLSRANLPPDLYARYRASLTKYLTVTRELLNSGTSALDAACHAVALLEDDPLFNCGRGSVFTESGTIEMEASVMVSSVDPAGPPAGGIKRAAAVSLVKNTRHPILLAKEVLLEADEDGGLGGTSTMHCQLSGRALEEWGWRDRGLEKKPDRWFWTKKRWEEHRRGLHPDDSYSFNNLVASIDPYTESPFEDDDDSEVDDIPSQGTVGAVCLDSWGNLAVATSTGGLTNKKAGRIGDTPTIGAGFWAEAWEEDSPTLPPPQVRQKPSSSRRSSGLGKLPVLDQILSRANDSLGSCLNPSDEPEHLYEPLNTSPPAYTPSATTSLYQPYPSPHARHPSSCIPKRRRAVAMSGTGNGDSFLRLNAVRTVAAHCRLSGPPGSVSLAEAVKLVTGPGGELQRSAGDRWGRTGEGQGGIIGIEVIDEQDEEAPLEAWTDSLEKQAVSKKKRGRVVSDFNCGGLFRAYYELDEDSGVEMPKVMVFHEEY
ncbi:uncharacterized protein Z520_03128 [Fonsecaea multimorphosa CBS 102226]|uniref:Asparaginase n=1 Tax=Fonsecaea multimorphosa CBS 102226 TaxID=1442371 RepID=A0A0D2HI33_9EURO|nr:uncharacterized protein Z520_03128 [Fonsecaea multimorphosa CBS 102226]KIY01576.1 hypothetical protein Z520_03128 [Fonsecaea multimorphosa CBS 102226]OAL28090.1 hypothetical protein AYO22_03117 [Fonsecaea multimorphosa]